MGEIAEMMLSGELCECCGVYIDEHANGIPRYCSAKCAADRSGIALRPITSSSSSAKVACPQCARLVKKTGLADHMRDAHGSKADALAGRVEMIQALRAIATDRQMKPATMIRTAREALAAAGVRL